MANNDIVFNWGKVNRNLPGANTDESMGPMRVGRRGEVYTKELDRYALADEGTYFYAHNNTNDASTTLAGHAAPVLADADATMTKPLVVARHTGASTSLVRSYVDYIEIEVVTAGANGTQACWAAQVDTGSDRYSSGTVETFTAYNANMQVSGSSPVTTWRGGPFVAGAESSSVRYLGHGTFRPSIEIAGDKYLILFGRDPAVANSTAAAAVRSFVLNLPPVVLGPTDMLLFALHGQASQNAAGVYKVRMGWFER